MLNVDDGKVTDSGTRLSTGVAPYTIDVSHVPFRTVQYLTVPSLPEGVAISPNGKWIAVQAMDGSNLTPDNPGRHMLGKVVLFEIRDGRAVQTSEVPGGEAAQGIVFTADSKHVIVQFNVERQLALSGGPSSLRTLPR